MTIVEALKTGKIPPLRIDNRWLYWGDWEKYYAIEHNQWVVRESQSGGRRSVVLLITPDEEAAVEVLVNGQGRNDEQATRE